MVASLFVLPSSTFHCAPWTSPRFAPKTSSTHDYTEYVWTFVCFSCLFVLSMMCSYLYDTFVLLCFAVGCVFDIVYQCRSIYAFIILGPEPFAIGLVLEDPF